MPLDKLIFEICLRGSWVAGGREGGGGRGFDSQIQPQTVHVKRLPLRSFWHSRPKGMESVKRAGRAADGAPAGTSGATGRASAQNRRENPTHPAPSQAATCRKRLRASRIPFSLLEDSSRLDLDHNVSAPWAEGGGERFATATTQLVLTRMDQFQRAARCFTESTQ